jgi:hypothetical protein
MNVGEHSIPAPASSATCIELDGETVLLNKSTGALHVLNHAGAAIWSRLDGSKPVRAIVAELSDAFEADSADVEQDVHRFLTHLAGLGLVESPEGWTVRRGPELDAPERVREVSDPPSWTLDTVWVDWYTAQVIDALRVRGIEAILLKGPAIKRWLYREDPGQRGYLDADLLVAAASWTGTTTVLSELGFEREDTSVREPNNLCADTWRRAGDGAVVDLHRTLNGSEHSMVDPWPVFRATAVEEQVGGTRVLLPSIPARAAQLALVSPADRPWRKWDDLERALERLPDAGWREAAAVARALGVEREFGYRLSQSPAGTARAQRIGVRTAPSWWLRWETDPILRWVSLLLRLPSWRSRLRVTKQLLLPSASYVRSRDLDGPSQGLVRSYAAWALHGIRLLPGAALTLLRSMR